MRTKLTARKSTGGKCPSRQLVQVRQRMEEQRLQQMTNNNVNVSTAEQTAKVVKLTPLNQSSDMNDLTITAAVGCNDPNRILQLPVKVVSHSCLEPEITPQSQQKKINVAAAGTRKKSSNKNNCFEFLNSSSDDEFNESVQFSKRKRSTRINMPTRWNSSSTDTSSEDEAVVEEKIDSSNVKPSVVSKKKKTDQVRRQPPKVQSRQRDVDTKKARMEQSYKQFIKKSDKSILFRAIGEKISGEKILKAYEKSKTREQILEEAPKVLELNLTEDSSTGGSIPKETSCLQELLLELFKSYCTNDMPEVILKTFGDKLQVSTVLENLDTEKLKEALAPKLTTDDLLSIYSNHSDPVANKKILEEESVEEIVKLVEKRKDLNNSEELLSLLLKSFSQNSTVETSTKVKDEVKSNLDTVITDIVKTTNLKNCDRLFNIMVQNGPRVLSTESKENVKKILKDKLDDAEFDELAHDVISFYLAGSVIHLD